MDSTAYAWLPTLPPVDSMLQGRGNPCRRKNDKEKRRNIMNLLKDYCIGNPAFCKMLSQLNDRKKYFEGDDVIALTGTRHAQSLRVIEYFVTIFQGTTKVYINEEFSTLQSEYLTQLKTYSKELFDPFRREHGLPRIELTLSAGCDADDQDAEPLMVVTTYCQVCFFKWAVKIGLFRIMELYHDRIARAMKAIKQTTDREHSVVAKGLKTMTLSPRADENPLCKGYPPRSIPND
jgi:hypothetical protein